MGAFYSYSLESVCSLGQTAVRKIYRNHSPDNALSFGVDCRLCTESILGYATTVCATGVYTFLLCSFKAFKVILCFSCRVISALFLEILERIRICSRNNSCACDCDGIHHVSI